jgi:hypothetical protein
VSFTLKEKLNALQMAVNLNDVPAIKAMLQQLVPGYKPADGVVDWVHLAQVNGAAVGE